MIYQNPIIILPDDSDATPDGDLDDDSSSPASGRDGPRAAERDDPAFATADNGAPQDAQDADTTSSPRSSPGRTDGKIRGEDIARWGLDYYTQLPGVTDNSGLAAASDDAAGGTSGDNSGTAATSAPGGPSSLRSHDPAMSMGAETTPPPTSTPSPARHKHTIQLGDADIDALLAPVYTEIQHSAMANMGPLDLYAYMKGTSLDTALMRRDHDPNAFYQYHGDKYPLLLGKTFPARDLNYLGVGAGFGARQFLPIEMNAAISYHKSQSYPSLAPSPEVLAAAETGRRAYGTDQAWRLHPND